MEPLYKVGDKVKVITRKADSSDYRFSFVDSMTKYAGEIVTIASVNSTTESSTIIRDDGYRYKIVEDRGVYSWASSMFSPLASTMSQFSDIPTTIKIKVKTNQLKFNFKN